MEINYSILEYLPLNNVQPLYLFTTMLMNDIQSQTAQGLPKSGEVLTECHQYLFVILWIVELTENIYQRCHSHRMRACHKLLL